ncbi:MAG TPA: guanylate kinase [Candidatus Aphodousia gallistercoris]|nr:guanylate kinase [Candidatus Aphodousia gallistercoris]
MLDDKAGRLFLVTAPSGAGKSSLVAALLKADPSVHLSISHTTRAPRPGEQDGREYHFVSIETFESMKEDNAFLEWAFVHGNYYGTSKKWLSEQLELGHDVLLEIDWQGALQVKRLFPDVVGIFILPPSVEALKERLTKRATDSPEVIARRLAGAGAEMVHAGQFDFVIINDDFQRATGDLIAIVRASRLTFKTQSIRERETFKHLGIPLL